MSPTGSLTISAPLERPAKTEAWFRRIAIGFGSVAAFVLVVHLGVLVYSQNEFSQPESIVALQSRMLARDGVWYSPLTRYPYTVNAYMPIFYALDAAAMRVGLPPFLSARLISFCALLIILGTVWRIALLYTRERYCAWVAVLLAGCSTVLSSWGTVGQVDTLAICFAVLAFYHFSRFYVNEERTLVWAGLFASLALLTKQTALASTAAIGILLLLRRPKTGAIWIAATGGPVLAVIVGMNWATHGGFLANTLFANLNPFAWEKAQQHASFLAVFGGQLILVVLAGARSVWRGHGKAVLLYLLLAAGVLALTAPKIGSDSNYQIEVSVLLSLGAALVLHSMNFFPLLFGHSKTWVTLLQLPLAIHMVLNLRMAAPFLIVRVAKEQALRQQVNELRGLVGQDARAKSPVISTDMNAMVHLRERLDMEPLIYTILVHGGRIDPGPVQQDLARGAVPLVILQQDVNQPFDSDPEIPTLPEGQIAEIRKRYTLIRHVPGPYLSGLYVYRPNPS